MRRNGGVVWLREIVDKIAVKHHVESHELEEVLANTNQFRFLKRASAVETTCMSLGTVGRRSILRFDVACRNAAVAIGITGSRPTVVSNDPQH